MTLRYRSTRGDAPSLDFADALLNGLAPDGGLYVPDDYPKLAELPDDAGYTEVATEVMWPFVDGTIERTPF